MTRSGSGALIECFDGVVCDLDGVIYRGTEAVPHAVQSLTRVLSSGVAVVYATNNASRSPAEVAAHLESLGLPGPGSRVVTSAQAGAGYLAEQCLPGARVLAIGGPGVSLALQEKGLVAVSAHPALGHAALSDVPLAAVLQGWGADVTWADLAEAAYAVKAGALWVATNMDSTLPTNKGIAPGNGALVGAVRQAVQMDPVVVGKPYTPLYELSVSVLGTSIERTLAIGDRLDTDIRGANAAGIESLFVFGGVHGWADLVRAEQNLRPQYVATDLRSLHLAYAMPVRDPQDPSRWVCGEAQAWVAAGALHVSKSGALNERLRAALAALWNEGDACGTPMDPVGGAGEALADELGVALATHR
jgi:glycerol 3-phosphatase-2